MTRLLILVEGQSEEIFVKRTLAPFLASRNVHAIPIVLWTKRLSSGGGFRGGVSSWDQIRKSLMPLTRDSDAWITTLLDFYGLPEDFPGYSNAKQSSDPHASVLALQEQFAAKVGHPKFIPFFALHEFEAWLFSAPQKIAEHFGLIELADEIQKIVDYAGQPEFINHGKHTHPKARLRQMVSQYGETADGPTLLQKIGIPAIRHACPHFADWLTQLETLGQQTNT